MNVKRYDSPVKSGALCELEIKIRSVSQFSKRCSDLYVLWKKMLRCVALSKIAKISTKLEIEDSV